jgi:hypothetical protein
MASSPGNTQNPPSADAFEARYGQICAGALLVGVALTLVALLCFALRYYKAQNTLPYGLWALALGLGFGVAGSLGRIYRGQGTYSDAERGRMLVLYLAGATGLATAILGLTIPFAHAEVFGKGLKVWRENMGTVLLCGGILFGGMLIMVAGLQVSRGFGLSFSNLRPQVLAYNAVLSSALLACILGLVNLLPYVQLAPFKYLNETYDWTSSRRYTLSDETKSTLASLTDPVTVYVLLHANNRARPDMQTLLTNCRVIDANLNWEMVVPEFDPRTVDALTQKYLLPESVGMLVVYGTGANASHVFVNTGELYREDPVPPDPGNPGQAPTKYVFTGEWALGKALEYLARSKTGIVAYFTQGHGEPPLEPTSFEESPNSLSKLRADLKERSIEVKPLKLDATTKELFEKADQPDKADKDKSEKTDQAEVVVIAGPTQPFPPNVINALRAYLRGEGRKNKGHLLVLLGPAKGGKSSLAQTGLDGLLAEYEVQAGQDRVLSALNPKDPEWVVALTTQNNNPLAKAFRDQNRNPLEFVLRNVRTVSPLQKGPGGGRYAVDPLLVLPSESPQWVEDNLSGDARALVQQFLGSEKLQLQKFMQQKIMEELRQRQGLEPTPSVAVAVSEQTDAMPAMPNHPPLRGGGTQPRMLVFGSAAWVNDQALEERGGQNNLDLFASGLSWLRERPNLGRAPSERGKSPPIFFLPRQTEGGWRLVLLPVGLLLLGVVVLGSGVWVVRRR